MAGAPILDSKNPVTRRRQPAPPLVNTQPSSALQQRLQDRIFSTTTTVPVYTPPPSTYGENSGGTGGTGGTSAAQQLTSAQAEAQAAATKAANNAARTGATNQKTSLLQAIDQAVAQKAVNSDKITALTELVGKGLAAGRDVNLTAIDRDLQSLIDQALGNYRLVIGDLNTSLRDNEASEADSSFANLANRARETQDVVGQALSMGAGESDVLLSQLQALRNWNANQAEVNRSYFDTLSSTNAAVTDLNTGTKNTMTGYELDANQRRGDVWGDFYSGMADSYTQLSNLDSNNFLLDQEIAANRKNVEGQDALLKWLDAGKDAADYVSPDVSESTARAKAPTSGYAGKAAEWAGKAWENPGVSKTTQAWSGQETSTNPLNTSQSWAGQANVPAGRRKKPEGATLRRW